MPSIATSLLLGLVWGQLPVAEAPFELVGNHIYLKGTANGRPVSILLDSGAGFSTLDADLAERWNVPTKQTGITVEGVGAATQTAKGLDDFRLRLDGTSIELPLDLAIPLGKLAPLEGRPIEAILGFDLFQRYVVSIDYPGRKIRFYEPRRYVYRGAGKRLGIELQDNLPHVAAAMEVPGLGKMAVRAMIDTGAGSAAVLTNAFGEKHRLDSILPKSPIVPAGAGLGGATFGRPVRLGEISLAGHRLEKPVATLNLGKAGLTGANSTYDVLIGGDLMRRFHVTFDYSRSRMYLEPNEEFPQPFHGDHVGISVSTAKDSLRAFRVAWVAAGTPAQEVGLKMGDRIVTIDGAPAERYELHEIRTMFRTPAKKWIFEIERQGESRRIELTGRASV